MTDPEGGASPVGIHIENLQIQSQSLLAMVIALHRAVTAMARTLPESEQGEVFEHLREVVQEMHVLQGRLEELAGRLTVE